jgi:hypothetical protein
MSYILQGSPYNSNENEYDNLEIKKQQRKNKTLKQPVNKDRPINNGRLNVNSGSPNNAHSDRQISNNAKNMIGSIHNLTGSDNDSNALADFYPPPHGELQNRKAQLETNDRDNEDELKSIKNYHVTSINEGEEMDGPVNVEAFNGIETSNGYGGSNGPHGYNNANTHGVTYTGQNNYVGPYSQKIPYYEEMSKNNMNKDPLLEKLNYMIHLLEEQQDEKTGHVIEELILYSFLGVFIIFIVDSFARAGKYTR